MSGKEREGGRSQVKLFRKWTSDLVMGNFTCVEMKGRVVDTMEDHLNCGHVRVLGVARLLVGFALLWS